jgi:hypothetical protein
VLALGRVVDATWWMTTSDGIASSSSTSCWYGVVRAQRLARRPRLHDHERDRRVEQLGDLVARAAVLGAHGDGAIGEERAEFGGAPREAREFRHHDL